MTPADDPRLPPDVGDDASAVSAEVLGYTALTQPQALASPTGVKGALFAQWGRQKRRNALQQRYGEDFALGGDDDPDLTEI